MDKYQEIAVFLYLPAAFKYNMKKKYRVAEKEIFTNIGGASKLLLTGGTTYMTLNILIDKACIECIVG